jgi:WD40 repeat protein
VGQPGSVALTVEHDGDVQAIAFSPNSGRFASGGGDSLLRVRAIGIGKPLDVPSSGFTSGIAFCPDGATFAVADFEQVFLRNAATGAVLWQGPVEPGRSVNAVRFGPDATMLLASTDRTVLVINADGTERRRITVERPLIADVDLSRDGTLVALAVDERHGGDHRNAGSARVIDLATGEPRGVLTPDNAVMAVEFSPDGGSVLCCAADDTTRMFDAATGDQLWPTPDEIDDQVTAPSCLAFDPKGRWAVIGGSDGFARILDADAGVERGRAPKVPPGTPDPGFGAVTHVAFGPSGTLAASASIDNVVRLFTLDGKERYAVDTGEVLAMAFSPDGRWLGLGCRGGAVVLDNGDPGAG